MADADILSALFNGGINGADQNDIGAFQKAIAANDFWKQAAAPIAAARFNTSTWSPGETVATTAGQAFLAAALGAIGQHDESEQLKSVAGALPALYRNPGSVEAPDGVDPGAFGALKLSVLAKRKASEATQDSSLYKSLFDIKTAAATEKAKTIAAIEGKNEAYGNAGPSADPTNPVEQKAADLRTEFDKRTEVQNFKYVSRLADQLSSTIQNPSAVADPLLAKMLIQLVEPGLAVNAGEGEALARSSSIPEAIKGWVAKAASGESAFPPEVRQQVINLAQSAYQAHANAYASTAAQFKAEGQRYNIPFSRISALGDPASFAAINGSATNNSGAPAPALDAGAVSAQYKTLRAAGKSPQEAGAILGLNLP